ncbi:class 1 fructose-bisphosphatase [Brackiella oedipodis]|uniref:class 1 fructose-bisphosphatase n=1 Tax=Brackiella oedipodis TaxID=124225 RepID=UPI0004906CC5|nr:class 1 fructose-bisphosphatase [Brackiella oedipodis]
MSTQTLAQFLEQHQAQHQLDAQLIALIQQIAASCRRIHQAVRQGALGGVLGSLEQQNVQGETQKKLDVMANDFMLEGNQQGGCVAAMASEEMDHHYAIPAEYSKGPYLLLFDPLDGSSNIDVNVSVGTIFSVLKAPTGTEITDDSFLQNGRQQHAAGYAIYGPQTMLLFSLGHGVFGFTLEPNRDEWLLTHVDIKIAPETAEFAINMSNFRHWDEAIRHYVKDCLAGTEGPRAKNFNMRWIASMVADVHRIMMRGGIFMYPWDKRDPSKPGKLRLMYEANPMSFLVEQAGGKAINADKAILDVDPQGLHQRLSVILGSAQEVQTVADYYQKHKQ